jgi:hypothetical protein
MQTIQFKSPSENVIHVATRQGHAARVGPEWRDLPPILHKEAIAAGCITSNMTQESIEAVHAGDSGVVSHGDQLKNAIVAMVDGSDPEDFTAQGVPNLKRLSARTGFNVDRDEMLAVWNDLEKATA